MTPDDFDTDRPDLARRRFQFGLAALLLVQVAVCVLMGIWRTLGGVCFVSLAVLAVFPLLLFATIWIARGNLQKTLSWYETYGCAMQLAAMAGILLLYVLYLVG